MEKTILKLNKEISVIILSSICILFSFLSMYMAITSFVSFLLVGIKCCIFLIVPLILYVFEKNNYEFKKVAGIYSSYFIINLFVTVITSISIVNGVVPAVWKILFDIVNLMILLSSLFILIESVLEYAEIKSVIYSNTIMRLVYLIGNFVSYPFLAYINKKINRDKGK